jgi:type II secretory pathway pseudopilin PulG
MIRTLSSYLLIAVLLAMVAGVLLTAGRLQRQLAAADQSLAVLNVSDAAQRYDAVATALAPFERIPWLLRGTREEVTTRQAAVNYWRGDYRNLVDAYSQADGPTTAGNAALQFVVANADYRSVQQPGTNRDLALGTLDHAIGVYRRLLEGDDAHPDTAFNYELMVRLRNEIAAGDEVPEFRRPTVAGNPGDMPAEEEMEDVQIYVPRDSVIDPDESEDPTIGEGAPIRKRG